MGDFTTAAKWRAIIPITPWGRRSRTAPLIVISPCEPPELREFPSRARAELDFIHEISPAMKAQSLGALAVVALLCCGCAKTLDHVAPLEVAQDPAAYGFQEIAEMKDGVANVISGDRVTLGDMTMVAGVNKEYAKDNSDGKQLILTAHYDNGKLTAAKWGGF
jgi:hypothetical protein